jgi:serine/threonine protein kinase
MPLAPGTRLGSYEVLSPLGAGGMGEVYLSRDRKLDRQVAVKVLPEAMTRDAERIARFEREAKLLAALNHSNIAAIHGFDDADGIHFLVMEYVDGATVAQRLRSGGFELAEALDIARQMATALETAHDKSIVHRDLKPANVMICKDGSVKVLDFGLAKALSDEPSTAATTDSSTITAAHTQPGVVLGTAAYMSPEQARGHALDARSDIWSFGVILFECLTGESLFQGDTANDSIGAILHKDPNWSRLPADTPSVVQLLLRRCLTKDRRRRLQAIGDARVELEEPRSAEAFLNPTTTTQQAPKSSTVLPWLACAALACALIITLVRFNNRPASPHRSTVTKSVLTLPPDSQVNWRGTKDTWSKMGYSQLLAVSRNGRRVILVAQHEGRTSLYLKDRAQYAPRRVISTEGARGPFFSPDGLWVGFLTEHDMQKVRLPGGAPQTICELNSTAFDATWLDDGTIVYSTDLGLWRVSDNGGQPPERLTSIDVDAGIRGHLFPNFVVGTQFVLFTVVNDTGQHAALLSLEDREWSILKQDAADARFVAPGYLVFARGGELLASRYDPADPLNVETEAPIASGVHTTPGLGGAVVHLFATSNSGKLIYAPRAKTPEHDALVWVDHEGNEQVITSGPGNWMHQRLSPKGDQILLNRLTADGMLDLYIYDLQRKQMNPLTRSGNSYDAEWSPDGENVGFAALDTRGRSIYLIPADFSAPARKIIDGADSRPHFSQWSHSASKLVFFDRSTHGGIWTAPQVGEQRLSEILNTADREAWAMISPDGQLIAYVGVAPDRRDVYVRQYPDLGSRVRVSQKDGGGEPRWANDSRTLYYREDEKIFKARITIEPKLKVIDVTELPFPDVYDAAASGHQHFDLSLDSSQFLMVTHGQRHHPTTVHVIDDWVVELDDSVSR